MSRNEALKALCSNYDFVLKSVRVSGVDNEEVNDVCEEIMVAAVKSIDKLKNEQNIKTWLSTIIRHKVCEYYRKEVHSREVSNMVKTELGEDLDIYDIVPCEATVENILMEAELRETVDDLLDSLPEINKRIIRMHFWSGYRFTEISYILGINVNTVRSLYRRSLQRLKVNSEDYFDEERCNG